MVGVDAEFGHGGFVGGHGNEVFGDVLLAGFAQEPLAGGVGVGDGFLRGEGFGSDDEQRGFGMDFFQHVAQLRSVHVGDEVHAQARMAEIFQRGTHHQWPQIGTADADIHHVGNHLVAVPQPFAAAHGMGEMPHFAQHGVHFGHHVFAVHHDGRVGAVAQGDVQGGAVFRRVDFVAVEHLLHAFGQTGFARQLHQAVHHAVGDAVFGIIQIDAAHLQPIALGAFGVLGEHFAHVQVFGVGKMLLQGLPCGEVGGVCHFLSFIICYLCYAGCFWAWPRHEKSSLHSVAEKCRLLFAARSGRRLIIAMVLGFFVFAVTAHTAFAFFQLQTGSFAQPQCQADG